MFVRGNTTSTVYIVFSFVFDSFLGGWISNSRGTCTEAGVEPGVLFVINMNHSLTFSWRKYRKLVHSSQLCQKCHTFPTNGKGLRKVTCLYNVIFPHIAL